MADTKISALPAATVPLAGTEVLPIVQSSATKQVSVANLTAGRAISASSVTNSALTSSRVTFAGTAGLLQDSANLTFDGTNASVGGKITTGLKSSTFNTVDQEAIIANTTWPSANPRLIIAIKKSSVGGGGLGINAADNITLFDTASTGQLVVTTTGVTMPIYGVGTATFSAAGVISSVSDENWKIKDGVPTNTDEMLQKLEPGYWFYNDEKKQAFGADRQLGFYAQNVHEAIGKEAAPTPETYVSTNADGAETTITKPWGYYDRSVLAVVVMSLKNALSTIEQQQTAIDDLTARLNKAGL